MVARRAHALRRRAVPDATLHALDPDTLADRWTLRLADRVGTSVLPSGDDLYGIYSLPAAYSIEVLSTGELLVSAAHGWTAEDGSRRNLSQLLRIAPDGKVVAAWPAEPADATLLHPAVDEAGSRVAMPVNRTAAGDPPADLPVGGLAVLDLATLTPLAAIRCRRWRLVHLHLPVAGSGCISRPRHRAARPRRWARRAR